MFFSYFCSLNTLELCQDNFIRNPGSIEPDTVDTPTPGVLVRPDAMLSRFRWTITNRE